MNRIQHEWNILQAIGLVNWIILFGDRVARRVGMRPSVSSAALRKLAKNSDGETLLYRPHSSDALVFHQIFIEREYAMVNELGAEATVIDCGANVGYSSAWFLSRFPTCRVLAIEPDSDNFRVLERNLAPYADRVTLQQCALWSHKCRLVPETQVFGDGREWSRQFVEGAASADTGVDAIGVVDAMHLLGAQRISLLKIDIEGAEAIVFSKEGGSWLHLVDTLVVELHKDSVFGDAHRAFNAMITEQPFIIEHVGELTICRRLRA